MELNRCFVGWSVGWFKRLCPHSNGELGSLVHNLPACLPARLRPKVHFTIQQSLCLTASASAASGQETDIIPPHAAAATTDERTVHPIDCATGCVTVRATDRLKDRLKDRPKDRLRDRPRDTPSKGHTDRRNDRLLRSRRSCQPSQVNSSNKPANEEVKQRGIQAFGS